MLFLPLLFFLFPCMLCPLFSPSVPASSLPGEAKKKKKRHPSCFFCCTISLACMCVWDNINTLIECHLTHIKTYIYIYIFIPSHISTIPSMSEKKQLQGCSIHQLGLSFFLSLSLSLFIHSFIYLYLWLYVIILSFLFTYINTIHTSLHISLTQHQKKK